MARSIYFILVLFLALGCSKDDESPSGSSGPTAGGNDYGFEAMVDSVLVQIPISSVQAAIYSNASNVPPSLEIFVDNGIDENFKLTQWFQTLPSIDEIQAGQVTDFSMAYAINGEFWANNKSDLLQPGYQYPPNGPIGELVILEVTDAYISGTFSFLGMNPLDQSTVQVSEGAFYAEWE